MSLYSIERLEIFACAAPCAPAHKTQDSFGNHLLRLALRPDFNSQDSYTITDMSDQILLSLVAL